jgi:predicted aspartyl protease
VIQGNVVGLEAQVDLILCLPKQRRVQIECVVDTGFAGALTLPPAIVAKLELPFVIRMNANLADDSNVMWKRRKHYITLNHFTPSRSIQPNLNRSLQLRKTSLINFFPLIPLNPLKSVRTVDSEAIRIEATKTGQTPAKHRATICCRVTSSGTFSG